MTVVPVPYDWRLSPDMLDQRDGLFALVKANIEAAVRLNGLPAILVAHSLGSLVSLYFFEWLKQFPNSTEWIEHHIAG